MDDDTRSFPIQGAKVTTRDDQGRAIKPQPSTIPWWLAEIAYKYYSDYFCTEQSLERLAERGGFGRQELVKLIRKENPLY